MASRKRSSERRPCAARWALLCVLLAWGVLAAWGVSRADEILPHRYALPIVRAPFVCEPIPGVQYQAIPIASAPTNPPASQHPDLNLALRGYRLTPGDPYKGFIIYGGETDNAPRLSDLFADHRAPVFSDLYQVYQWDGHYPGSFWPLTDPEVTLAGLASTLGEVLHTPGMFAAHEIYGGGYQAMVLYATEDRLTLKYTREDNVVQGYTLHLEGICVEPSLLALYRQNDASGRGHLPGLRERQPVGRARGAEVKLAIRDVGSLMDPRSYKDWWRDLPWLSNIVMLDARGQLWFERHQRAVAVRAGRVPAGQ